MKLSLEWLRDHVEVGATVDELAGRLTAAGHAVDAVTEVRGEPVLELDITTNRPDCMNVRGLAREVGALYRLGLTALEPSLALSEEGPPAAGSFALRNDIPELCRRFTARVVRGARVGPSPAWVAARLERAGLRPINNLVDITNYVMLELGHPLHAFDLAKLRGGRLHVRQAAEGERLTTLDGTDRRLSAGMILICDAERPVSLAGVMGGQATEISDSTTEVLLEAAWWDPVTIYRTGRALGLSSDAAYRFERGADLEATLQAVDRAARLVADLAGGRVAPGRIDDYPRPLEPRLIRLRPQRMATLLGVDVPGDEAIDILRRLGFVVQAGDPLQVTAPSYRGDVQREEDVIEEVGRIFGYDRIPEPLPTFASDEHGRSPEQIAEASARRSIEAAGFHEALNVTFSARADDARLSPWPDEVLELSNPMSERGDVLRSSLLPGLLRNAAHNVHHGAERLRLYEIGRVFRAREGQRPEERLHLGLVASGSAGPIDWSRAAAVVDPYDVKGALESLLRRLRAPRPAALPSGPAWLHPEAALTWRLGDRDLAWMGRLEPDVGRAFDLEADAMVAELDLGALLALPRPPVQYREIPRYPSVSRDLSLVLPEAHRYAEVETTIRAAGGDLVREIVPFDRYAGSGLPEGTVGLSVRLWFRREDRTLVSQEVDEAQAGIVKALEHELGARLRA